MIMKGLLLCAVVNPSGSWRKQVFEAEFGYLQGNQRSLEVRYFHHWSSHATLAAFPRGRPPQRDPRPRRRRGNLGRPVRSPLAFGGCGVFVLSSPRAWFTASPVLARDPAATLASAASASARCSGRGRDTSRARIAAFGVSFMAGTASSSAQCRTSDRGRTTAR